MNIAVLIDAENIDPVYANQIFTYAASRGTIVIREIYGSGIALNEWSSAIFQYVLHTNMTLRPSRFKNSTDIALVIGAMDLLVKRATQATTAGQAPTIDMVIIVSSDSDYSALALHLRASGVEVVGMGEKDRVNPSWPRACSEFITLTPTDETHKATSGNPQPTYFSSKSSDQETAYDKARSSYSSSARRGHAARKAIIQNFISEQLSKNNGQMPSSLLFNLLKDVPDYQCDQKKSNKNPIDYLNRQYSDLLKIEKNSEGVLWVYSKLDDMATVTKIENSDTAPYEETPQQEVSKETEEISNPLIKFLCDAGVGEEDAQTISSSYEESSSMRNLYNSLRKIFKTEPGTTYYKLVKQYKEGQNLEP